MATQFKFSKSDGLTRRVTFAEQPTWFALATKLEALYHIAVENVGVSYIDNDGDEVTLSTHDELMDFYRTSVKSGEVIKFAVKDLSSLRRRSSAGPRESDVTQAFDPFADPSAGPVDGFVMFEPPSNGEWAGLDFFANMHRTRAGSRASQASRHSAFVEVLDSDYTSVPGSEHRDHPTAASLTSSASGSDTPSGAVLDMPLLAEDKGKAPESRRRSHNSSTASLFGEEEPEKIPVHVMDVSEAPLTAAQLEVPQVVEPDEGAIPQKSIDDPPLPEIETAPPTQTASLTLDIAGFINSLQVALASHPELSEGLRNMVRSATNGTYWGSHREAMSRAAEEITRATRSVNTAEVEAEAGRRVTEAIGGFFRVLAEVTGTASTQLQQPTPPTETTNQGNDAAPPLAFRLGSQSRRATQENVRARQNDAFHGPPPPQFFPRPIGPNPPPPMAFGSTPFMPPPFPPVFPPPSQPFHPGPMYNFQRFPPNTSHLFPPSHLPGLIPNRGPVGHSGPLNDSLQRRQTFAGTGLRNRSSFPAAVPLNDTPPDWIDAAINTADPLAERKARLEAAKEHYKTEKEKWRKEREERRREKTELEARKRQSLTRVVNDGTVLVAESSPSHDVSGTMGASVAPITTIPPPPPLHGSSQNAAGPRSARDMTLLGLRVTRRLEDMGFSESAYPIIPQILPDYLHPGGTPTKDTEDTIITKMLEQLLVVSPRPPPQSLASGSNVRGSWA